MREECARIKGTASSKALRWEKPGVTQEHAEASVAGPGE